MGSRAMVASREPTRARIPDAVLEEVRSGRLAKLSPQDLLAWGLEQFFPRIALSASFGSPDGMVLLDMMHQLDPARTRVFTIDTGRLPQETHNLIDRVRERYEVEVEVYFPDMERVQKMVRAHGANLFFESPEKRKLCCSIRKVEPLERAMADLDAWISGLRPEQSVTRASVQKVEIDDVHDGRIKLNPLATWTKDDVWAYVRKHAVPVNKLHGQGYPSVGCAPCSRAIRAGEDERAGRWWWERPENRECGIHTGYEEEGSGI